MNNVGAQSAGDSRVQNKPHPVQEVRLGAVKAAIWRNETENGARYNVTVTRIYRDGDQWRTTESFGRDELLLLAKVADHAHTWICNQAQEEARAASQGGQSSPAGQPGQRPRIPR